MREPRLRGGRPQRKSPYPLGQFPDEMLIKIGKQIIHRLAVGYVDITGNDFGAIFASAASGVDYTSPQGIVDVGRGSCGWSIKTVKVKKPFAQRSVRLISGRNSPTYSQNIDEFFSDKQKTGEAVLSIWNARVNEAMNEYSDLRIAVLIRNIKTREFVLFEEEIQRYTPNNFRWKLNKNRNFQGHDAISDRHCFTWQPHGAQYTIIRLVPGSARRFKIVHDIPIVSPSAVLKDIQYRDDWIQIH